MTILERIQFKPGIIVGASIMSFLLGTLFYFILQSSHVAEVQKFPLLVGLYALGILFFGLLVAKDRRVSWEFAIAVFLVCGVTLLVVLQHRGTDYQNIMTPALPLLMILFVGFGICGSAGSSRAIPVTQKFFLFLQKLLEIIVASQIAFIVVGLLGLLAAQLFSIIEFALPDALRLFVICVLAALVPFVMWLLTYNFEHPIELQQPVLAVIKFYSVIGYALTWVLGIFLGVYVFVLLPLGFDKMMHTGKTAGTFLALCAASAVLMYAALLFQSAKNDVIHKISTAILLTVVSAEALCMSAVALYALVTRIDAHGITLPRYLATMFSLIAIVLFISYIVAIVHSVYTQATLTKLKLKIEFYTFAALAVCVVVLMLISVVNFEFYGAKMHIDKVVADDAYSPLFDLNFISQSGPQSVSYLAAQYARASVAQKMQLIVFFQKNGLVHVSQFAEEESDSQLQQFMKERTDVLDVSGCVVQVQSIKTMSQNEAGQICSPLYRPL